MKFYWFNFTSIGNRTIIGIIRLAIKINRLRINRLIIDTNWKYRVGYKIGVQNQNLNNWRIVHFLVETFLVGDIQPIFSDSWKFESYRRIWNKVLKFRRHLYILKLYKNWRQKIFGENREKDTTLCFAIAHAIFAEQDKRRVLERLHFKSALLLQFSSTYIWTFARHFNFFSYVYAHQNGDFEWWQGFHEEWLHGKRLDRVSYL